MIDLYYWTTPNGHKITLFLEEAGFPYTIRPVNLIRGDQFKPEILAISPNNRIPAIVDKDPGDSGRAGVRFRIRRDPRLSRRENRDFPRICAAGWKRSNGSPGRSAALAQWPARTIISSNTR